MKDEFKEERIFHREEEEIKKDFKQVVKELQKIYRHFKGKGEDERIVKKELKELSEILNKLEFDAKTLDKLLDFQYRFLQELGETEKEEFQLENLEEELLEELEMDKKEVDELLKDSQKIQDKRDIELAKEEELDLQKLIQHWQEEEQEMEQINKKIEKEVKQIKDEIDEEKALLEMLEKVIKTLNGLEKLLNQQIEELGLVAQISKNRVKNTINMIDQIRTELQEIEERDKDKWEKAEDKTEEVMKAASKVKSNVPSGAAGRGARATISAGKMIGIAALVFFVIIAMYASGGSLPI